MYLLEKLTVKPISLKNNYIELNGIKIKNLEISQRQFCLEKLIGNKLKAFKTKMFFSLMKKNYKIIHPLPVQWIYFFNKNGLKVNFFFHRFYFLLK